MKVRFLFSTRMILDISDAIQKLEQSQVDLGENSNQEDFYYTEEIAKIIQD